jgi:MraZ protein
MGSRGENAGSPRPAFAPGGAQALPSAMGGGPAYEQGRRPLSFTGEFRHSIDAKGRLIVPSRLRDELENDHVVLTQWLDGCIAMWSGDGWRELELRLLEQRRSDSNARAVVRAIVASAHTDEVDRQGRVTVPPHLRELAGITKDVVVTGALDHAELWSPEAWEGERSKVAAGKLDDLAQELNF